MRAFEIKTNKSDYSFLIIANGFKQAVEMLYQKGIYDAAIVSVQQLESVKSDHILIEERLTDREVLREEVRRELQEAMPKWMPEPDGAVDCADRDIYLIRTSKGHYFTSSCIGGNNHYLVLDTLEQLPGLPKQGEQKSADKVEPKFKVGDWIVSDDKDVHEDYRVCKITKIVDGRYYIEGGDFLSESSLALYKYRLWTIQDAKDGDVLDANGAPFIYKKHDKDCVYFYCGVNLAGEFIEANWTDIWNSNNKVYPATKEQRDLLFQKMHEKGYEWDADKKELSQSKVTKISDQEWSEEDEEQFSFCCTAIEMSNYSSDEYRNYAISFLESLKDRVQPKQEWSEEDEKIIQGLIRGLTAKKEIHGHTTFSSDAIDIAEAINWLKSLKPQPKQEWSKKDEHGFENCLYAIKETFKGVDNPHRVGTVDWLKSLKDRVQPQPKQEWSEEDIEMIDYVASILNSNFNENDKFDDNKPCVGALVDFLKSLKYRVQPQPKWEPSDEQIKAVRLARSFVVDDFAEHPALSEILIELEEQLKKLKG